MKHKEFEAETCLTDVSLTCILFFVYRQDCVSAKHGAIPNEYVLRLVSSETQREGGAAGYASGIRMAKNEEESGGFL